MTSIVNSFSSNPTNGQILQGTYETVPDKYDSFSVSITSDQSGQLKVYYSHDGTSNHHIDTYSISQFPYHQFFKRLSSYVKVTWENNSGVDSTDFNLKFKYHHETLVDSSQSSDSVLVYGTYNSNNYALLTDNAGRLQVTPVNEQLGDPLNVANNISLNSAASTSSFDVSSYAQGWINYEDTDVGVSDTLTMFFSNDDVTYHKTNIKLTPTVDESGTLRIDTKSMDFRGFKYIIFYNDASVTLSNVKMSIIGSNI